MNFGPLSMAYRNLSRNKRRNIATGTTLALGFAGLVTLGAYSYREDNLRRVHTLYKNHTGHITIYKHGGFKQFEADPEGFSLDAAALTKIKAVLDASSNVGLHGAQLIGSGLVSNGCENIPFIASGIEPALSQKLLNNEDLLTWEPDANKFFKGRGLWDYAGDIPAVILGEGLANLLHKTRVFDEVPKDQKLESIIDCKSKHVRAAFGEDADVQISASSWSGGIAALDGEVVAHLKTGDSSTNNTEMQTSLSFLQKVLATDHATYYSVWIKDESRLQQTMDELKGKLKNAGLDVDLYPFTDEDLAPLYTGFLDFLHTLTAFIKVIVASIVIFSVFNSATITVMERGKEIGMMRSLGFTRRRIRVLFIIETAFLAAISLGVGCFVAALLIFVLNHAGIKYDPPGMDSANAVLTLVPNLASAISAGATVVTLAVAATLFAAWSVAKQPIANLIAGAGR